MECRKWTIAMALFLGCCVWNSSPAVAQNSTDCSGLVGQLLPCFNFIQGTVSEPSSTCCTGLNAVAATNVTCICQLATQGMASGASSGVNVTRALELPQKCKSSMDASVCNLSVAPAPTDSAPAPQSGGNDGNKNSAGHNGSTVPLTLLLAAAVASSLVL